MISHVNLDTLKCLSESLENSKPIKNTIAIAEFCVVMSRSKASKEGWMVGEGLIGLGVVFAGGEGGGGG